MITASELSAEQGTEDALISSGASYILAFAHLERMTVETPFLCKISITARASSSFVMVLPDKSIVCCFVFSDVILSSYTSPVSSSASN